MSSSFHAPTRRDRIRRTTEVALADWRPAAGPSKLLGRLPAGVRSPLRIGLQSVAAAVALVLATGLFYMCLSFRYDLEAIRRMPERSVMSDRDGNELATIHGENRRLIGRDEIPPFFVRALLAREDQRFMSHHGIDPRGMARAVLRNFRDRAFTQGASTLTMQLARNSIDLGGNDLHRKGLELALALRMERRFPKDDILTAYVNRVYFGSGCHGLEEAARRYFHCSAAELNPNQCALLAGIIRAPHAWSPRRDLEAALAQRDEVLERLVVTGVLGAPEAARIRSLPLRVAEKSGEPGDSTATRAVRRHAEAILAARDIRRGGLHLASTLDAGLQSALEAELATVLASCPPEMEGAAVCVECRTGAIRAIVGGRSGGAGSFNRALDARRDVGSVMTPFVFAAAAERDLTVMAGEPIRTGRQMDPADLVRLWKRLGFTGPFAGGDDLYRGALGATPLELATAAATLGNGGARPRTYLLERIRDADGRVLFSLAPSFTPALGSRACGAVLREFLTSPHDHAGPARIVTGRSLSRHDAWGLAFGPRFASAIWLGHDEPRRLDAAEALLPRLREALVAVDRAGAGR